MTLKNDKMDRDMMFDNILLPLPSEYFPNYAVKRAIQLATRFNSQITMEYIFEKQLLQKLQNVSSGALACQSLREMVQEVKKVELEDESNLLFNKIEELTKDKHIKLNKLVRSGIHTEEIMDILKNRNIDLIITEFHKEALLKYRILYDSPIPIWIEHSGKKLKKIYGILTNLSPNKLVPEWAFKISKKLDLPLKFYYILDSSEQIDEEKEQIEQHLLLTKLKKKRMKYKISFEFDVIIQEISSFLNQYFKKETSGLVILGRFKKPVRLPFLDQDKKIEVSKKLGANVLIMK
jgi:nucleotide-binding universal stress UspA family protein